jgi:hypothetical protein
LIGNNNDNNNQQLAIHEKQITLDEWLIDIFRNKLRKISIAVGSTGRPFVLYRNIIEEANSFIEEEVTTINEKYAIVQVFVHGGFIQPSFHQQYVFTIDEFPLWIMKRSYDLLLQCLESIDEQMIFIS